MDPVFSDGNAKTWSSSSAHETSFVQEDGETGDSDNNEEDSCEITTIQTYEQIEAVDKEDMDSAFEKHPMSSQRSQVEP